MGLELGKNAVILLLLPSQVSSIHYLSLRRYNFFAVSSSGD